MSNDTNRERYMSLGTQGKSSGGFDKHGIHEESSINEIKMAAPFGSERNFSNPAHMPDTGRETASNFEEL